MQSGPKHAHIEPTTLCNLKCQSCITWSIDFARKGSMTLEQLKNILEQIPSLEDVSLLGLGEPFMNPAILDMAEEVKRRNLASRTATNGTFLHKFDLDRLVRAFDELIFSFDAATKEVFEKVRCGADFDLIMDNMGRVREAKIKANSPIDLTMNTVISNLNYHDISGIVAIAENHGISKLRFIMAMDTVGLDLVEEKLCCKAKEIREMQINDLQLEERFRSELGFLCTKAGIQWSFQGSEPLAPECWWPRRGVYITYDGYVTPCCIRMDPGLVSFGNLYEQFFEDIWSSTAYSCFREGFKNGIIPAVCRRCPK